MAATPTETEREQGTGTVGASGTAALSWPRLTGRAAAVAVVANLALFAGGSLLGADFRVVQDGGAPMTVGVVAIVLATALPLLVAFGAASMAMPRWAHARRALQVLGTVVALASLAGPLGVEAGMGTRLTLSLMHVVTGAAYVTGLHHAADR